MKYGYGYSKKIYIDENSLAMGNPLSSLAAEILKDNLENEIQKDLMFNKFIFGTDMLTILSPVLLEPREGLIIFRIVLINYIKTSH